MGRARPLSIDRVCQTLNVFPEEILVKCLKVGEPVYRPCPPGNPWGDPTFVPIIPDDLKIALSNGYLTIILPPNFIYGPAWPWTIKISELTISLETAKIIRKQLAENKSHEPQPKFENGRAVIEGFPKVDALSSTAHFNGSVFELEPPQIKCLKVMIDRHSSGFPITHQKEICKLAGLEQNVSRLDQVFRSRAKELGVLIKREGKGKYSLNL